MANGKERPEFYSGIPWVHVTPEQARNLPQGTLNAPLIAISLYFLLIGMFKFGLLFSNGAGVGVALLNGAWPFLTGVGLALRVPWSIVMALISSTLTVWALVRGSQAGVVDGARLYPLFETIINVGILFYLVDGDRPNLIYRHRFRKYSIEDDQKDEALD